MTDQGPDISGSKGPGEDEVDLAAAEYVLGLTEGDARSIARERASADPAFAARIDAWEQRFSPLTGDVGEVTPPDTVWERIAGSIIAPSNVVALPNRPRWMNSLTVWRATAALSTLAAACLDFGKGRHPAKLNFGDCFAYALAKATGEPLLYKGDDFSKTDVTPAITA